MLQHLRKQLYSEPSDYYFTILIPSWNNLPYLKLCVQSIQKNSTLAIQIVVIANEAKDGTLDWLEKERIDHVHSSVNMGICFGLNSGRSLIKGKYVVYVNDDMYLLPGWDRALEKAITEIGHQEFMISSTMIEPIHTGNPCVVVADYGRELSTFREEELCTQASSLQRTNWLGSTWPPNVLPLDLWDLVGGMSIEFSPGMYSDPDLSMKLYKAGVRCFVGIGDSLVYHFGSKSTGRVKKNRGRDLFLLKWGISGRTFYRNILRMGVQTEDFPKTMPDWQQTMKDRFKRWRASWRKS